MEEEKLSGILSCFQEEDWIYLEQYEYEYCTYGPYEAKIRDKNFISILEKYNGKKISITITILDE